MRKIFAVAGAMARVLRRLPFVSGLDDISINKVEFE